MNKKRLWKRIFGQQDKKARAQAAFQEQFETKLQFRELEPRVVLAADAVLTGDDLTITFSGSSNEAIEFSRDGDGNIVLSGIDSLNGNTVSPFSIGLTAFDSVSIVSNGTGETSVTFAGTLDGVFASTLQISNVNSILVGAGADFELTSYLVVESVGGNGKDSQMDIHGKLRAASFHANANTSASVSLTVESGTAGGLDADTFHAWEAFGNQGQVVVDLSKGTHDIDTVNANGKEVELAISDVNSIELETVYASKLSIVAGTGGSGSITQTAGHRLVVDDTSLADAEVETATFVAAGDITLANSGNQFAGIVSADGEDVALLATDNLLLGELTADSLTIHVGGSLTQATSGEKVAVAGVTNITISNSGTFELHHGENDFVGAIQITGAEYLSDFHLKNVNAGAEIPLGDLDGALSSGAMNDVTFLFANAGSLALSKMKIDGDLTVRVGGSLSQSDSLDINGTTHVEVAEDAHVTFANAGNDFTGAVSVVATSGRAGTVQIDDDNGNLVLGDIDATVLSANTAGGLYQNGSGVDVLLATDLRSGTNSAIELDSLDNVFGGEVSAQGGFSAGNVVLNSSGAIALGNIWATQLSVTASTITQSSAASGDKLLVVNHSFFTATGAITLDNTDNDFNSDGGGLGSVDATGTDVVVVDRNEIILGEIDADTLSVTAMSGGIAQTGRILVKDDSSFLATGAILLSNMNNDFNDDGDAIGAVDATGTDVVLRDSSSIILGDIDAGTLTVEALAGSISQTDTASGDAVRVKDASTLMATNPITLDNANNDFNHDGDALGAVDASGTAVTLVDQNSLLLGNIHADTLAVTATAGSITQTDAASGDKILVKDNSTFVASAAITLDNTNNDFNEDADSNGTLGAIGAAVTLVDKNSVVLGNIDSSSLDVTALGGSIAQSGAASGDQVRVKDASAFTATTSIELTNTNNDFNYDGDANGSVDAMGTSVALTDENSIHLGDIAADSLNVLALSGSITQTDAASGDRILVSGGSSFGATFLVTLDNTNNDLNNDGDTTGAVNAAGTDVKLFSQTSIILGDIDADNLSVTAQGGSITQTDSASGDQILVKNHSFLRAASAVTLTNANNNFNDDGDTTGAVDVVGTDVALTASDGIILGDVDVDTLSTVALAGSITQTQMASGDKILVKDDSSFVATGAITLDNENNDFNDDGDDNGCVSAYGTAVTLVDANSIHLCDVDADTLIVTALDGSITQTDAASGDKILVKDDSTFTATEAITLNNGQNDFNDDGDMNRGVDAYGAAVTLYDVNSIVLRDVDADSFVVEAFGGSITQANQDSNDKILVKGNSTFTATANILLNDSDNDFNDDGDDDGCVSAYGTVVTLVDANSIHLCDVDADTLAVMALDGSITQTDAASGDKILVKDDSTFRATEAITLNNEQNDFNDDANDEGCVSAYGTNVTLVDKNSIVLGDIDAGTLTVAARDGSITQTPQSSGHQILVEENSTFTATGNITLDNTDNDFNDDGLTGWVTAVGTEVTLTDKNSIILGNIDAEVLTVTAEDGSITQTTAEPDHQILVEENSTFTATGKITLDHTDNDFNDDGLTGWVTAVGTEVTLTDKNSIILGNIDADTLTVAARDGSITQTTANPDHQILVEENSTFTATGKITLDNSDNDFNNDGATGWVTAIGTEVKLVDTNSIILGNIYAETLTVTAEDGSITQTTAEPDQQILVEETSAFTATAEITLENKNNNFTFATDKDGKLIGCVEAVGTHVSLRDADAIQLGDITASRLTVTAGDDVTQCDATALEVREDTVVRVADGADVLLSQSGNDFGKDNPDSGSVSVVGIDRDMPGVDKPRNIELTDSNSILLADIEGANLLVTAGGDIKQLETDFKINIDGSAELHLTADGSVELHHRPNNIDGVVTVKLDEIDHLENFHLRNESENATTPSGDLAQALAQGQMHDVTFIFPNADSLKLAKDPDGGTFNEIDIHGNLDVVIAGILKQCGPIYVDGWAAFEAKTIKLGESHNLIVDGNASFTAAGGDIYVGVANPKVAENESINRGKDSDKTTKFGSLTFVALADVDGERGDVTIYEDDSTQLTGDSKAVSLVLKSKGDIETQEGGLAVRDLAWFRADGEIALAPNTDAENVDHVVDLRILYVESATNVSIVEESDFDGTNELNTALALMDGTEVTGTLTIVTGGHLIQVNDVRQDGEDGTISAKNAIFVAEGSVVLTDVAITKLAGRAGVDDSDIQSTLNVTPNQNLDFEKAGIASISTDSGFNKLLTTDGISKWLPDEAKGAFASTGATSGTSFASGSGENYSFIAVNTGDLLVTAVHDPIVDPAADAPLSGVSTVGDEAGHVFLMSKAEADDNNNTTVEELGHLTFQGSGAVPVIELANAGILTALAEGTLTIEGNTQLVSHAASGDAVVKQIYAFQEQVNAGKNPELGNNLGIVDGPFDGPTYLRKIADTNPYNSNPDTTLFLQNISGVDSRANVMLTRLGVNGEQDFRAIIDWGDGTTQILTFDAISNEQLTHFFASTFVAQNPNVTVTVTAYNSPLINLFDNLDSNTGTARNLNFVEDRILMIVNPIPPTVPDVTSFQPPANPLPQLTPTVVADVSPITTLAEFSDDTRVATPIEGVSVIEVDKNDPTMTIGEEIQLGDEFMTLDAVKERIQRDQRFSQGLYRITILYPGVETPQVFLFEKKIVASARPLFGNDTPQRSIEVPAEHLADVTRDAPTAEEVWAREYEKWFPTVVIERAEAGDVEANGEDATPADERQSRIPDEEDILLQRVSLLDLQDLERLTERLRSQRSIVRDSLNGALVGGAALMAASAVSQAQGDGANPVSAEKVLPQDVRGGALDRLRRRLKQWL